MRIRSTHDGLPGRAALVLCLLAAGDLYLPVQAQPPYGSFLRPGDVITGDTTEVAIPGVIDGDTVVRARFHVRYSTTASNEANAATVDELIAVDSAAPFQAVWDCADVPDQDSRNLRFYCTVLTSRGEWKGGPTTFVRPVALDRNPAVSDKLLRAVHDTRPLAFDGDLREWHDDPSVTFANGDNRISVRACWNDHFLCFAVRVDDAAVFPSSNSAPPGLDTIMPVHLQDGIQLFFDLFCDRTPVPGDDDYHLVIGATGVHTLHSSAVGATPSHTPLLATRSDEFGYSVEVGLSWEQLPFSPAPGSIIGFNIVNVDREAFAGSAATGSWANLSDLRRHNPSEWASLVLIRRHARWPWVVPILLMLAAVLVAARRFRRKRLLRTPGRLSPVLRAVMAYLEDNYQDDKLDSKAVAASVYLREPQLGRMIRHETGKNFRELLNEFRLQKAKGMLLETELSISEVSYRAGFSSPGQFSEVFSRFEHTTPSQFRKRRQHT